MPHVGSRRRPRSVTHGQEPAVRGRGAVCVRMYCHGLGDCFLVTIPRENTRPFFMLIDCGIILGTKNAKSLMTSVVDDVRATTKELDVVVVTHEHWDHVSGFVEAEDAFGTLAVHDVWVGWTENPSDPLARKLKVERKRTVEALRIAALRMNAAEPGSGRGLLEVLSFFGPEALGVAGGHSTEDAMQKAMALSPKPPRYCRPADDPFQLPELEGVRFYVLGPPRDEERLKRARPTKSGRETYDTSVALSPETCFLAAATEGADGASEFQDKRLQELARPFDARWTMAVQDARRMEFFQKHYFDDAEPPDQEWRGIDEVWLGSADQLALQLDTYTNNTSLVLAIEFVKSRKVMLFAADAQVGNWLSWADQTWQVVENGERHKVTADDLLNRTVLYKVGHHGSHNATMRAEGLEKMKSDELMAVVPVDREMAVTKRWSGMPFPALMTRLQEKTSGRVLRIDDEQAPAEKPAPEGVPEATWSRFQKNVRRSADKLYYDIQLPQVWGD
jgi:hypothetical protein